MSKSIRFSPKWTWNGRIQDLSHSIMLPKPLVSLNGNYLYLHDDRKNIKRIINYYLQKLSYLICISFFSFPPTLTFQLHNCLCFTKFVLFFIFLSWNEINKMSLKLKLISFRPSLPAMWTGAIALSPIAYVHRFHFTHCHNKLFLSFGVSFRLL